MLFDRKTLMWRTYITNKVLLTIKQMQIINKKNFVIIALNADNKTFVVHMIIQKQEKMLVHAKKQTQIKAQSGIQVGILLFNKTFTEVLAKYSDYSNVFSIKT